MQEAFWWVYSEEDVAAMIESSVERLKVAHSDRMNFNLNMLRMYSQRDYAALDRIGTQNSNTTGKGDDYRMRLNVVGAMIDTVTSRIGKSKPKPMYLTKRGDYQLRNRAQRLTDVMEGLFVQTDLYPAMQRAFHDSCIFDIGVVKITRDAENIFAERVFPNEMVWPLEEALYGEPRTMHQIKQIHQEDLMDMFPEFSDEILSKTDNIDENSPHEDNGMMEVVESWRKKSPYNDEPGRHVISVGDVALLDEDYNYNWFPFEFHRWSDAVIGFGGLGMAEQLKSVQIEINRLVLRIQQSMHLLSVPFIFLRMGSKVAPSHIRNVPGTIISYMGEPPQSYTPQAMHPEVYSHLDRLYQRAYEIAGVSELSASGKKPAGLESGAALRVYHDIETERFAAVSQRYEQSYMDCAEKFMEFAKEISEEQGKFPVKGIKENSLQELDFKDIQLAEKDFILQPFPVSLLPTTPSGRLQAVTELINSGVIDKREHIVRLLDFPDLASITSLYEGYERDIEWRITEILDSKKYHAPHPFMDLTMAVERGRLAYLEAEQDGVEKERIDLLERFISEAMSLLTPAPLAPEVGSSPAPEVGGQQGPIPTAPPVPPPTALNEPLPA